MNISARDRRAVTWGVIALAAICACRYVVLPVLDSWGQARDEIDTFSAAVADEQAAVGRVLAQRDRLVKIFGPGVNAPLADPDTAQVRLLETSREVLAANGFELAGYDPQRARPIKAIAGVDVVPLQVRGTCKLPQLAKCLAALRQTDTLVFVDRMSVINDRKKPGKLTVTLVLATLAERKGGAS